jgi:hypothetical protein
MRNIEDSRQQSYCRACGLIVVDSVCPYCGSSIDEPLIHESKSSYRSRLSSVTGAILLIVAGVTPAVVSARESVEAALITPETVVVSTTTVPASVMESTSTTLLQSSDKNTTQNTKTPTTQKPKKGQSSPSGSVYVAPPITTTVPPGPHGKIDGGTSLWTDGSVSLKVSVGKSTSGSAYVGVFSDFPTAISFDSSCLESSAPIYKYESFHSIDGGVTGFSSNTPSLIPSKNLGCNISGLGIGFSGFSEGNWRDMNWKVVAVPVNFYAKFKLTNLRSGKVIESPWVLVDWSKIP